MRNWEVNTCWLRAWHYRKQGSKSRMPLTTWLLQRPKCTDPGSISRALVVTSKSVWTCSLRSWGQRLMTVSSGNSISTSCPANFINNLPQFSHLCPVSSLAECISASEVPHAETLKLLSNPQDSFWTHSQWKEWHLLLHQLTNQRSNWQLKSQGKVRVFKWVASFILNNKNNLERLSICTIILSWIKLKWPCTAVSKKRQHEFQI